MIPRPDILLGALTHVGMERSENQDYYGYYEPTDDRDFAIQGRLVIVCDGMGGHAGGEVASQLGVRTIIEQYMNDRRGNPAEALRNAIEQANRAIWGHAQANPPLKGMGSTGVAMALVNGHAYFGHVGDSRVYMIRQEQLIPCTKDHSLVQQMCDEGLLQESEMESHPEKNVILRSLGVKPEVEVEVNMMQYAVGDIFIMSTDGLTGLVSKEECRRIGLLNKDNPMEGARLLVDLANKYGGYDNVTVQMVVIRAMSPDQAPPLPKVDQTTGLYSQDDVAKSIAAARATAAKAGGGGPSEAEMLGNQKKPNLKQGATTAIDVSNDADLAKARAEMAEKKKAGGGAAGGAPAKGGSKLPIVLVVLLLLVAVGGLVARMQAKSSNIDPLVAQIQEAKGAATPLKNTDDYKKANDAFTAAQKEADGLLGPFTAKPKLEENLKAWKKLADQAGQSSGELDKARKGMEAARQQAADAGAEQRASEWWQKAVGLADGASKRRGKEAVQGYADATNAFSTATDAANLAVQQAAAAVEKKKCSTAELKAATARTEATSSDLAATSRSKTLLADADALVARAKGLASNTHSVQDAIDTFDQAEQRYHDAINDMKQTAEVGSSQALAQQAKRAAEDLGAAQFGGAAYADAGSKLASAASALDAGQYQQAKDGYGAAALAFTQAGEAAKGNVEGQARLAATQAAEAKQACAEAGAASTVPADLAAADRIMAAAQAKLDGKSFADAKTGFGAARAAYDRVAQAAKKIANDPDRQGAALEQQAMTDVKAKCSALKGKKPDAQSMSWAFGEEQGGTKDLAANQFASAKEHFRKAKLFYQKALETAK